MSSSTVLATATAHGKINLHLGVGAVRDDGYHDLATVFQAVSAADELTLVGQFQPVNDDRSPISGMFLDQRVPGEVPTDASNLAWRAVDAVVDAYRGIHGLIELPEVVLSLKKRIPVAGGMAGGSADAAAALVAADHWLSTAYAVAPLGKQGLTILAARLGADVPFVLAGGTALGTGRGDELVTMLSRGQYHWAVVTTKEGLSTPEVFRKLDELRETKPELTPNLDTSAVAEALAAGNTTRLAAALHNDLQAAALSLRPDLRKILQVGEASGALAGIVSGSGPSCVFLCEDAHQAVNVLHTVTTEIPGAVGTTVAGPVGGASVAQEQD